MIDNKIFFSVIVPLYNKVGQVNRCIQSVLKQKFSNFELILVDDSSTDGSLEIAKTFKDNRIILFSRSDPGPGGYAARNLGALKAKGEWLTFLDADDEWLNDHLVTLHNIIRKNHNAKVVSTSWYISKGSGKLKTCRFSNDDKLPNYGYLSFDQFLNMGAQYKIPIHTNIIGVKKEVFMASSGFPEGKFKRGGDISTWLKLVSISNGLYYKKKPTAIYHLEDSTVAANTPSVLDSAIKWQVSNLLNECNSFSQRLRLKRFANAYTSFIYIKKLKLGKLKYVDCSYYYFEANFIKYLAILILSLLPSYLQVQFFKISKAIFS